MSLDNQEQTLRPSKGKWALMLLLCGGFVAGGFWMANDGDSSHNRFWGYFNVVFFGLGVVVAIIQFVPGSSFLRINSEGITVRSMWRTSFYRWSDVERFGVAEFSTVHNGFGQRHRLIGLDFSSTYAHRDRAQRLKRINRNLTGFEAALPDNYGWDYTKLADHLNELKDRYDASPEPTTAVAAVEAHR